MFVFRLFKSDEPLDEIATRLLLDGQLTLGRDPSADWTLPDPDNTLSRIHCTLAVDGERLLLCDSSTNGTFLDDGARAPRGTPVAVPDGSGFRLGALKVAVDRAAPAQARQPHLPLSTTPAPLPAAWPDEAPVRAPHRDASLIEAFCEGAKLDSSALSSEDPAELMRRVGAIYQQTVLGLATLMAERTRLKTSYALDRTTVAAADNNPFKWAGSRRLAEDLLRANANGFLSDADAVRASFHDLGLHLAGIGEGAQAALDEVMRTFAPASIEEEARSRGPSLRGRAAICWDIHTRRHAALDAADGAADNPVRQAFARGYGRADTHPAPARRR